MSSFTKTLKAVRRTHRERAQPAARKHLGLLEKRSDWKQRRDDFHKKEKTIKTLRRKAEARNPDEFYQDMVNTKTKDGIHIKERDTSIHLDHEEMQLLKTQDRNYINLRRTQETKKIEKLQSDLHFMSAANSEHDKPLNTHTVFVDSTEEAIEFDPEEYFDTPKEFLADRAFRPRREDLKSTPVAAKKKGTNNSKAQAAAYKELVGRRQRVQRLAKVADTLELEKNLAAKGRKKKVRKGSKTAAPVYKWRQERKR